MRIKKYINRNIMNLKKIVHFSFEHTKQSVCIHRVATGRFLAIINQIAHFSFTHIKFRNNREEPWQLRNQKKAHNPGKVKVIFSKPHNQQVLP